VFGRIRMPRVCGRLRMRARSRDRQDDRDRAGGQGFESKQGHHRTGVSSVETPIAAASRRTDRQASRAGGRGDVRLTASATPRRRRPKHRLRHRLTRRLGAQQHGKRGPRAACGPPRTTGSGAESQVVGIRSRSLATESHRSVLDAADLEHLRCPLTQGRLHPGPDGATVGTEDGQIRYPVIDGVICLTAAAAQGCPGSADSAERLNPVAARLQRFYGASDVSVGLVSG